MDTLKMIIEIAVFAVGIYLVLRFLRETRGSGVVRGLMIVLLGGLIAFLTLIDSMGLQRLGLVFEEVTATIVLALVIVFHQEIRRAFVQLGDSQIFGGFFRREVKTIQRLLRSVARLSKDRVGALIAIEREGSLANLAETGVHIDAELNSFLIESIFFPGSALHDGAIVIRGDRLVAASCLLPLSQNQDIDKRLGTRHRAALGLTEESDALAIVVSEETGTISTSVGGKLEYGVDLEHLEKAINEHQHGRSRSHSPKERRSGASVIKTILADPYRKLIAMGLALTLWLYLDRQVTGDLTIEPQLATVTSSSDGEIDLSFGSAQLSVVLSSRTYSIEEFSDTSVLIGDVELMLEGTNSELAEFTDYIESLRVELDVDELSEERDTVDFRLEDVAVRPQRLKRLFSSMEPRTVRVNLVKNEERTQPLSHELITWPATTDRLNREETQFARSTVRLRGPATAMSAFIQKSRLFRVNVHPGRTSSGQRSGDLALDNTDNEDITMEPALVSFTVPVVPEFTDFEREVRVVLNDTLLSEEQAASLEVPERISVKFQATGELDSRLQQELDDSDSDWLYKNAYVMVQPDAERLANNATLPGKLRFVDRFREGTDYRLEIGIFVTISIKD
ncbi:MAG: diadenylate cyclase CdaA [Planctomycetota bacterium]|jgi:diadenylate cyclase